MWTSGRAFLIAFLASQVAWAQTRQQPHPGSRPAAEPKETRLRAEKQEMVEKGHFRATGFVDLQTGDMRIQSDVLDRYETELPDGFTSHRIVATGNVVFLRGDERIAGVRLEMDMTTGVGTFDDAIGYIEPGVYVEARIIKRLDPNTYRLEDARFSSCAQPNPRWGFSATSARIVVDDKIIAKNVAFWVKSVPAFYLPYLYYPIREDQRSTGFMLPHLGYSSTRGFIVGEGFFWAMGRSADQTFNVDHYSRFGDGFGHELRYVLDGGSRGSLRSYVFRMNSATTTGRTYDLTWNAIQNLPRQWRATLNVREYSSITTQQQIQDTLDEVSTRTSSALFNLQGAFGKNRVRLTADSVNTYWGDTTRTNEHLPALSIQRYGLRLGKSPFFVGYEATGAYLGMGSKTEEEEVPTKRYTRFDVSPNFGASLATSYLQLTPRISARYTRYGTRIIKDEYVDDPLTRTFFEGGLDIAGPTFARVYDVPGKLYSDKIKHVIGPEIAFLYRSRIENFSEIPWFDSFDQYLGTNQVQYSLVQSLFARRATGAAGKKVPYEFLTWRISQTYYVQISDGQNNYDPNYSSSSFGPGRVPSHYSPIQSYFKFRPTRSIGANFNLEYNPNYHQLHKLSVGTNVTTGRVSFLANWARGERLAADPAKRVPANNFIRASGRLVLLPGKLQLEGGADYDLIMKRSYQSRARLRYDVQCCGFGAEMVQTNYNQRVERSFIYFIELANIGSIGNFLGGDPNQAGGAGLGMPR